MATIKELLTYASDELAEVFHRKPFDAAKHRKALIKRLDNAKAQYASTEPRKGRKMFVVGNEGVVKFTSPVEINGKTEFYFDAGKFAPFLEKLSEAVGLGEFDAQLEKNGNQPGATSTAPKVTRKRAGWSPERRAAHDARKAQKK